MKIRRYQFLNSLGNILLALVVLNLSQGCKSFQSVKKNHKAAANMITSQESGKYTKTPTEPEKYVILYCKNGVYHLSDFKFDYSTLTGTLSELSGEHLKYLVPPGEKLKDVSEDQKRILLQEVVIAIQIEIPINSTVVTIRLRSIDKVYSYRIKDNTLSMAPINDLRTLKKSITHDYKTDDREKYFILYGKNGVYHLSGVKINGQTLIGTVSGLSEEHMKYHIAPGEKLKDVSEDQKWVLSQEVVFVTQLEIPQNSTVVTIPWESIDKIYIYKMKLPGGVIAAIILLPAIVAGLIAYIVSVNIINRNF